MRLHLSRKGSSCSAHRIEQYQNSSILRYVNSLNHQYELAQPHFYSMMMVSAAIPARRLVVQSLRCRREYKRYSSSTTSATSTSFTAESLREHTLAMVQKYDYPNYLSVRPSQRLSMLSILTFSTFLTLAVQRPSILHKKLDTIIWL